jgi:hypothetical protein
MPQRIVANAHLRFSFLYVCVLLSLGCSTKPELGDSHELPVHWQTLKYRGAGLYCMLNWQPQSSETSMSQLPRLQLFVFNGLQRHVYLEASEETILDNGMWIDVIESRTLDETSEPHPASGAFSMPLGGSISCRLLRPARDLTQGMDIPLHKGFCATVELPQRFAGEPEKVRIRVRIPYNIRGEENNRLIEHTREANVPHHYLRAN